MQDPGHLFTRSQLVEKALGYDYEGLERTIDVHILNLRRKIESGPNRQKYIITVYGRGYKLGDMP
jgi:DNA-binding response OmpR family regulator